MIKYSFFEYIMRKSKQKRKSTREPQLSENSREARKRSEQYVFNGMVVTSLERKTIGDVYGYVKEIIHDTISVSLWMTGDSLKCAATRHNNKISNNKPIYKEEAEIDKSEHQTSVLGLIYSTKINGGRPKGSTLKNKKNLQTRMDEAKIHLTYFFYRASNLEHRSVNRPLISFIILSSEVYFSLASTSNIMAFLVYSRLYNSPKPNLYLS